MSDAADAGHPARRPPPTGRLARLTGSPRLRTAGRYAGRLLVCMVIVGVVGLPHAFVRALENTRVQDTIGVAPATFTLNAASRSELRLGVPGSFYIPESRGPIGLVATVDGPPASLPGNGDIAAYVSPQMLEVYSGLFHDPGEAIGGYIDLVEDELRVQLLWSALLYAGVGGLTLFALSFVVDRRIYRRLASRGTGRKVLAGVLVMAVSTGVAGVELRAWAGGTPDPPRSYALPALDGTRAEGTTTDSAVLRLAIGGAIPKVRQLLERQESQAVSFADTAAASLRSSQARMEQPAEGEVAILMQSDMHCNAAMIAFQREVVQQLDGAVGLLAITGDLTTNGTAAEGSCIEDEAAIAGDAPVVAVTGNHESETSAEQMDAAGMTVLDGDTVDLDGTTVLGDGDPERSEMFGATEPRGEETQSSVGRGLYAKAQEDRPDLVLMHEAYAAQAFIGRTAMTDFLDARGSATVPWDDDVRDLPASAIFYGHWHRGIEPRVVWNSDGSWTLVMELNTSGGAIDSPTLNHFSTPWSRPQQEAAFAVVFKNEETGLVTGYQLYTVSTSGEVTVAPRVDVGVPGGEPVSAR